MSSDSIPRYTFSATLIGHESDVKAVSFPNSSTVVSASRDGSVKLWKHSKESNSWAFKQLHHGSPYVNSVAWLDDKETRMYLVDIPL